MTLVKKGIDANVPLLTYIRTYSSQQEYFHVKWKQS